MARLKRGINIRCRNKDEIEVFKEVAYEEGHCWSSGSNIFKNMGEGEGACFQVGCGLNSYPNDITFSPNADYNLGSNVINIEASDLFRNHLISRRAKHERNSTK